MYEARRKYTTTIQQPPPIGSDIRIEFDVEDGVDPVSSEPPAQRHDLGPGNLSQPGDLDEMFDEETVEAAQAPAEIEEEVETELEKNKDRV